MSSRIFPSDFKLLRKSCHDLRLGSSLLFTSDKLSKNCFTKFCWNHESWLIIKTTLKLIEPTSRSSRIFQSDFLWQSCHDLMLGSSLLFTSYKLSKSYFLKFCWNHDKSFQHFIETAIIASLRCWGMEMLIGCLSGGVLRQKTLFSETMQNKAWKLTALSDNGKIALKTPQAAQGPAVSWLSCEITDRAEL